MSRIADFGISIDDSAARQLNEDRMLLQLGVNSQRVDILTFLDGCDFEKAFQRSNHAQISGLNVKFLSVEDYVLTKNASGKRKDLRDLEDLREALGTPLPGDKACLINLT